MDSNWNRLYKGSMTFVNVLLATSALSHLTSYMHTSSPSGSIAFHSLRDLTENKALKADQANIQFEMEADFTSEFEWNLNQIFVMVVAEYSTKNKARNEVTVWDFIVQDKASAKIAKKVFVNEYPLRDEIAKTLLGDDIVLKIYYHRMPIMGLIQRYQLAESPPFTLPSTYKTKKSK